MYIHYSCCIGGLGWQWVLIRSGQLHPSTADGWIHPLRSACRQGPPDDDSICHQDRLDYSWEQPAAGRVQRRDATQLRVSAAVVSIDLMLECALSCFVLISHVYLCSRSDLLGCLSTCISCVPCNRLWASTFFFLSNLILELCESIAALPADRTAGGDKGRESRPTGRSYLQVRRKPESFTA